MSQERYTTPDGKFTLIVESDGEAFTLWFEGYPARVYGAAVATFRRERDEETAVRDFLDELFHDEAPIVIKKKNNVVVDAWPHEEVENEPPIEDAPAGESYELRYWSGETKTA
jgi:hypothetical protein